MRCPRPGCPGEVVNGNCQVCGIAVAESAEQQAERLRRQAEEHAERLRQAAGGGSAEDGTGWFRTPDVLDGAEDSPRGRGAHRRPEDGQPGSAGQPSPASGDRRPAPGPQPAPGQQPGQGWQPGQGQPGWQAGQAQPGQAPTAQAQVGQWQPTQSQPSQPWSGQAQPGQARPGQAPAGQWQPTQSQPSQPESGQVQPGQMPAGPWQATQSQPRHPQSQPSQAQPGQPQSGQPQPGQPQPGPRQQPGPPQWQPSQSQPGQPAGHSPPPGMQWAQGVPVPNVLPRQPGVRPATALAPDEPQPTSVLGETPITQSIEPPPPPPAAAVPPTHAEPPPTAASAPPESAVDTGSSSFPRTGRRTSSRTSGRGRLGAGLVEVPVVPVKDPASAVLTDPAVSENKRFCNNCGAEVGRGRDGRPGEAEGECATCDTPFNFRPRLHRGDLVGGQYEVLGSIAYGGLGWIYLAKDHNVSDRWVVLKGMIDTGDATSMASAVAERRFLAEVEHPNVVRIYNFVQHPDAKTGTSVGYIVMEYVGGQSLRQLALEHHRETGRAEPLPIGQVIAYGLEILPAIGYLHSIDMLYCDLKPDNVIQSGEQLKLIDLGAVRQTDDYDSPLFFTLGYSAPELATEGASVASDIYTVGRTLAVLSIEFAGYTTRHKYTLPGPDEEPLFALFGSYYRVLKRATHADPQQRFTSAEEMADQLTGVLREVMALGTGRPRPGQSTVFAMETRTFGSGMVVGERGSLPSPDPLEVASIMPLPMVDSNDHAASTLASITATEPAEMVAALSSAPQDSIEVRLRMVRARLELGDLRAAANELEAARRLVIDPADWRPDWYEGLIATATRRPDEASKAFDRVYDAVPGEIPPKLALAICAEYAGNYFAAARYYELVWRTDRAWVSAAFGLARVYLAQGARAGAIEVLEAVPDTSSHHVAAQVAAIKIKTRADEFTKVGEQDLHDAARRLERLALDAERRTTLAAEVLEAAYSWVRAGRPGAAGTGSREVLGCKLAERDLRFGLERCYRALARLAATPERRHDLVDKANAIRPRTLT